NAGLHRLTPITPLTNTGYICANVYVFTPDEQMAACCTCPVSANGTRSLSARRDLISNPLTGVTPTALTIKLVATTPPGGVNAPFTCNAGALPGGNLLSAIPPTAATNGGFASGMRAWITNVHVLPVTGGGGSALTFGTETRFEEVGLSA